MRNLSGIIKESISEISKFVIQVFYNDGFQYSYTDRWKSRKPKD